MAGEARLLRPPSIADGLSADGTASGAGASTLQHQPGSCPKGLGNAAEAVRHEDGGFACDLTMRIASPVRTAQPAFLTQGKASVQEAPGGACDRNASIRPAWQVACP
jgi:hypothetical protein